MIRDDNLEVKNTGFDFRLAALILWYTTRKKLGKLGFWVEFQDEKKIHENLYRLT